VTAPRPRATTVTGDCHGCDTRFQALVELVVVNAETGQWQVMCPTCARPVTGVLDAPLTAVLLAARARLVPWRGVDDVIADETLEALIWPDGDVPVWPVTEGAS
jgi:hypothetical protein